MTHSWSKVFGFSKFIQMGAIVTGIFYRVAMSPFFNLFITIMIFANTFILALDRHPLDEAEEGFGMDECCAIASFTLEMIIKLIGLGVARYCKNF